MLGSRMRLPLPAETLLRPGYVGLSTITAKLYSVHISLESIYRHFLSFLSHFMIIAISLAIFRFATWPVGHLYVIAPLSIHRTHFWFHVFGIAVGCIQQ